jgi:hypothetical protein
MIQRLYDFQPGTKISSQQMDDELTQLVNEVNNQEMIFAKKQQETWHDLGLVNGWVNVGDGNATAQYMKDEMGFVHIKGYIKGGLTAYGNWIAYPLPSGYRPLQHHNVSVGTSDGNSISGDARIQVDSDGNIVTLQNVGNTYLQLSDILPFLAES